MWNRKALPTQLVPPDMEKLTGIFEMLVVFGGVLGLLVWQLVSLKRSEHEVKRKEADQEQR